MKQLLVLLCAILLSTVGTLTLAENPDTAIAPQEPTTASQELELIAAQGFVLEANTEYLLLQCEDGTQLQANLAEDTVMNISAPLTVGDYAIVYHSGMMTRSIPPQVTAITVLGSHVTGTVSQVEEAGFLLTQPDGVEIWVHQREDKPVPVQDGETVTVYYDGRMTFSLPGQINALHIRGHMLEGVITTASETELTLKTEQDEVIVHLAEETMRYLPLEPGARVRVVTTGIAMLSLPPQYVALEILPAE